MFLLGLTGSIGMGKSQTAQFFGRLGLPVYDADAAIHALYARGGKAVQPIAARFPDAIRDEAVDRGLLAALVLDNAQAMKDLERIAHPLVGESQWEFLIQAEGTGAQLVVLDIPLLFETGGQSRVDAIAVVSAPAAIQAQRVLSRPGMTPEKFQSILAKQLSDREKRAKADFVIETGLGLDHAFEQVKAIAVALAGREGKVWEQLRARNRP